MKSIVCGLFLIVPWNSILAQTKTAKNDSILIANVEASKSKIVKSCDNNSSVVNMSARMEVSKQKLPKVSLNNGVESYNLKSANKSATFYFKKEKSNRISVWIKDSEKHCFVIDPLYKLSFNSYSLSQTSLEVYGKVRWDKFYKNFRIIFYFQKDDSFFDFDDEIL